MEEQRYFFPDEVEDFDDDDLYWDTDRDSYPYGFGERISRRPMNAEVLA